MDVCRACGSDQVKIGVTNIASGATVFPYYCGSCGKVHTQYAKKKVAHQYAIEVAPQATDGLQAICVVRVIADGTIW
jgi:protein-arginine kinase activator protein McsA